MRSVILRSRPGRPRWQLTTRPGTAVVLGVVSLAAAGVQIALLSSPTPWYQPAVAGFWALVGLAFLASAAGTRVRARRAAEARMRVPVDTGEVTTGEPTEDLTDAVQTAATPVVTGVLARSGAVAPTARVATESRRSESAEPTTRTRNRHAVRAVLSVETASREIPVPAPAGVPTAKVPAAKVPVAEVPVAEAPAAKVHRPAAPEVRRPATPATRGPAAPAGAVPSPRRAPDRSAPERPAPERTGGERTAPEPAGRRRLEESRSAPSSGGSGAVASRMTFGSGARVPAPTDTGRHAMVEPREVPAPRERSSTPSSRRARHAAPPAKDRVR